MNTLIISSDLPRLGSQAQRPTGERKRSGARDLARVYSVCTRSNQFFLRPAHGSSRNSAIALDDGSEVGVSDISACTLNWQRLVASSEVDSTDSGQVTAALNGNPSPCVVRLAHSVTGFHLSRHTMSPQGCHGSGFSQWKTSQLQFCPINGPLTVLLKLLNKNNPTTFCWLLIIAFVLLTWMDVCSLNKLMCSTAAYCPEYCSNN